MRNDIGNTHYTAERERHMKPIEIPKIGMRIIKSAIGIFLCYVVNQFRFGQGLVFYSLLAVLWCMQDYVSETKQKAKQRSIGTVIGAVMGLVYLVAFGTVIPNVPKTVEGILVAVFIVLVLYMTVLLKKKQASYFSCVVFLSVVVNHVADKNPYLFVWNRFLDTMIGIGLGVFVNTFHLPREKHPEILFVSGLDDTLLNEAGNMSDYSRVELNRMIESGLNFTISTQRTPASLMEPLSKIRLKLPMIVMDGAALFDLKKKSYELVYVISASVSKQLVDFFEQRSIAYFANVIMDDLLVIYYSDCANEVYQNMVQSLRASLYRNYVKRPLPNGEEVVYFMLIDKEEKMKGLYEELMQMPLSQQLKVIYDTSKDYEGYAFIKIYNHNANKENMLDYLSRKISCEKLVTYGTIPGHYTHLVDQMSADELVRQMKREYEPYKWFS